MYPGDNLRRLHHSNRTSHGVVPHHGRPGATEQNRVHNSLHNWDRTGRPQGKKTHWDSAVEFDEWGGNQQTPELPSQRYAMKAAYAKNMVPQPHITANRYEDHRNAQAQRKVDPSLVGILPVQRQPSFEGEYCEEPFVAPARQAHGRDIGSHGHDKTWMFPTSHDPYSYVCASPEETESMQLGTTNKGYSTAFANGTVAALNSLQPMRNVEQQPRAFERRGLDIVNPNTGEKVVVNVPAELNRPMNPPRAKLSGRSPLPITNPSTGQPLAIGKSTLEPQEATEMRPHLEKPVAAVHENRRCHAIPIIDPKTHLPSVLPVPAVTMQPSTVSPQLPPASEELAIPKIDDAMVVHNEPSPSPRTSEPAGTTSSTVDELHPLEGSTSSMEFHDTSSQPEGEASWPAQGRRKLDEQSLTDLAREHHVEDQQSAGSNPPSVPSPDNLSMDDTPGPSDEEKEPPRTSRRPAFRVLEERFRSRSASPRLYHLYCDHSPAVTPRALQLRKVYTEATLKALNNLNLKPPLLLQNPKLAEIFIKHPLQYVRSSSMDDDAVVIYVESSSPIRPSSDPIRREDSGKKTSHKKDPTLHLANRAEDPFILGRCLAEEDALVRKITGILNKLTPEKYGVLLKSMYEALDQNGAKIHEELLERIIGEVHECALEQPNYSEMYAILCSDVCNRIHGNEQKSAARSLGQGQNVLENFRRILLNKCQARFIEGMEHIQAKPAADMTTDMEAETLEKEQKFRFRSKGNIRFIGELFKGAMLSERIMHKVIKKLLLDTPHGGSGIADAIEVLCTLLRTAGRELDRPEAVEYMTHYFNRLSYLSTAHPLPRIRFMILDIIALRENGWMERRRETKALKLSQMQKERLEEGRNRTHQQPHQHRGYREPREAGHARFEQPEVQAAKSHCPPQPVPTLKAMSPGAQSFRPERLTSWMSTGSDGPSTPGLSPASSSSASQGPSPHTLRKRESEWRPQRPNSLPEILSEGRKMVTEEELRFEAKAQMMLDEWYITGQNAANVLALLDEIPVHALHQFWVCALEFTSRTNKYERYRANLVLLIRVFVQHHRITIPAVIGSIMKMIDRACRYEAWVDSPGLWHNLSVMLVDLMSMGILLFDHLVDICSPFFQQQQEGPCQEFLTNMMHTIQGTQQFHLYNPQVALTLYQALSAHHSHAKGYHGQLTTLEDFIETLAY